MIRELTSHKVNGLNDALRIEVLDEPGPGNACHRYHITTLETPPPIGGGMSREALEKAVSMSHAVHDIRFQNGPIAESGVNGVSNEALLAIVEDLSIRPIRLSRKRRGLDKNSRGHDVASKANTRSLVPRRRRDVE